MEYSIPLLLKASIGDFDQNARIIHTSREPITRHPRLYVYSLSYQDIVNESTLTYDVKL